MKGSQNIYGHQSIQRNTNRNKGFSQTHKSANKAIRGQKHSSVRRVTETISCPKHRVHFDPRVHVKSQNPQALCGGYKEDSSNSTIKYLTQKDPFVSQLQYTQTDREQYSSIKSRKSRTSIAVGISRAEFDLKMENLDQQNLNLNLKILEVGVRFDKQFEQSHKWLQREMAVLRAEERRIDECMGQEEAKWECDG